MSEVNFPSVFISKNAKISIGRRDLHFKSKSNGKINEECIAFWYRYTLILTILNTLWVSHCTTIPIPKKAECHFLRMNAVFMTRVLLLHPPPSETARRQTLTLNILNLTFHERMRSSHKQSVKPSQFHIILITVLRKLLEVMNHKSCPYYEQGLNTAHLTS